MVEATEDKWEEQEQEIESLQYIFPEEFKLNNEKPYKFEIMINSNTESEDKNFLKLRITFDLQEEYPNCIPFFRVKNLSTDYIDNAVLDKYEDEMRELAEENMGSMMIFQMCDLLKEKITEINEKVLDKLAAIEEKESFGNALKAGETTDQTNLNFTPVTAETFAAWCDTYMERIIKERIAKFGIIDDKPTGK